LQNPDGLSSWENVSVSVGSAGTPSRAWRIDNYYYNAPAQEDRLVTPMLSLAGSSGTRLKFHHAYAPYGSGYDDALRVEISTNCGAGWTTLYQAAGAALGTAPQTSNAWSPTAAGQWLLHDIDLSAYDGQVVVIRFVNVNDYGNRLYLDNIAVENNGLRLALKVLLDGPYDAGTQKMNDGLRAAGLIPALEPYTAIGFVQAGDGGGEVMHTGVAAVTGDNAVVDWLLVELRNSTSPSVIVATRAALVQRDGDVVAEDGYSPVALSAPAGSYRVAVRHRNHLGAMTATALALSTGTTSVDFTTGAAHGTEPLKQVAAQHLLWAGNVIRDVPAPSLLKYTGISNDRDPILGAIGGLVPTNTLTGQYRIEDVTLDGVVKYTGSANDRDRILANIGGLVPTNTRTEQLP
jgi:hypothetical protein